MQYRLAQFLVEIMNEITVSGRERIEQMMNTDYAALLQDTTTKHFHVLMTEFKTQNVQVNSFPIETKYYK